jgi:hypothetical protein
LADNGIHNNSYGNPEPIIINSKNMQILPTQPAANKKTNTSIGLFLLCLFVAVALVIFLGYPKYSDWKMKKQEIITGQQSLAQVQEEAVAATSEIAQVDSPDLNQALLAVPGQADIANLYADIENMSQAANVKLTSLQAIDNSQNSTTQSAAPATDGMEVDASGAPVVQSSLPVPTVPSGLQTVNITLQATGDYNGVEQMISSIYRSLRIIDVQKITLSTDQGNGGTQTNTASSDPTLDLQLQLLTYYSK